PQPAKDGAARRSRRPSSPPSTPPSPTGARWRTSTSRPRWRPPCRSPAPAASRSTTCAPGRADAPCPPTLRHRGAPPRARPRLLSGPALLEAQRQDLGDARLFHGDAVQQVGRLHALAVVRDEDELGLVAQLLQKAREALHVGLVERRVDLVQDAERRGAVAEQSEEQRHRRQRLLPSR